LRAPPEQKGPPRDCWARRRTTGPLWEGGQIKLYRLHVNGNVSNEGSRANSSHSPDAAPSITSATSAPEVAEVEVSGTKLAAAAFQLHGCTHTYTPHTDYQKGERRRVAQPDACRGTSRIKRVRRTCRSYISVARCTYTYTPHTDYQKGERRRVAQPDAVAGLHLDRLGQASLTPPSHCRGTSLVKKLPPALGPP